MARDDELVRTAGSVRVLHGDELLDVREVVSESPAASIMPRPDVQHDGPQQAVLPPGLKARMVADAM